MKLKRIYILIQVFIWSVVFLIFSPWPLGLVKVELATLSEGQLFFFLLYGMIVKALMVYTYAHVALPVYLEKRRPGYFVQINLIYLFIFSIFEGFINQLYIGSQLDDFYNAFWESVGNLTVIHFIINLFLMVYANLNGFAYAWFRDEQERRSLEKAKLHAELSSLKQQIHPHFLFNTLNSLYGLAYRHDDEATAEGIAKLSRMMRYMIYEARDEWVPLTQEIAYIQDYIDLQRLRLNENNEVSFQVLGNPEGIRIAPMIFISFVENAFKYGVSTVNYSDINIVLEIESGILRFSVDNPIHAHHREGKIATSYSGVGHVNVKKRLKLIYKHRHELSLRESDGRYVVDLSITL